MNRPKRIQIVMDFPHWMKIENGGKSGLSAGLNMTVKAGSNGFYNYVHDTYHFSPTLATETHGFYKEGDDINIWYYQYENFVPVFRSEFLLMLKSFIKIIDGSNQQTLF